MTKKKKETNKQKPIEETLEKIKCYIEKYGLGLL